MTPKLILVCRTRVQCYDFFSKDLDKKWRFSQLSYAKTGPRHWFKKNRHFFRRKLVKIADNDDHNIGPLFCFSIRPSAYRRHKKKSSVIYVDVELIKNVCMPFSPTNFSPVVRLVVVAIQISPLEVGRAWFFWARVGPDHCLLEAFKSQALITGLKICKKL
jgi:hypothetical protein